jgi:Carboxypeptidase regulatory-like domain
MPRCSSFLVVIILMVASFTPVAGRPALKQFGKIKGRVVDVNKARIVGADVLIAGEGLRFRITTNSDGEFETALPIGEYQFSVEAPGFRRFASQKFEIKTRKTQSFSIEMQVAQLQVPASPDRESDFFYSSQTNSLRYLLGYANFAGQDARVPSHV